MDSDQHDRRNPLLDRADAAIADAVRIRSEGRTGLVAARSQVQTRLRLKRAGDAHARATLRARPFEAPRIAPWRPALLDGAAAPGRRDGLDEELEASWRRIAPSVAKTA